MNLKGIVALTDETICMNCLKKEATHIYEVNGTYGKFLKSINKEISFDVNTIFQCCDDCNKQEYKEWFSEKEFDDGYEKYKYREQIWDLINSLPLESQELFENRFDKWSRLLHVDSQDWIDHTLNELPYEKCKKYHFYSEEDWEKYETRFKTCEYVINVNWNNNSKRSCSHCPFGVSGDYIQKVDECTDQSDKCVDCLYYKKRENEIKEIKGEDLGDWMVYMKSKLKEDEYKQKFESL